MERPKGYGKTAYPKKTYTQVWNVVKVTPFQSIFDSLDYLTQAYAPKTTVKNHIASSERQLDPAHTTIEYPRL